MEKKAKAKPKTKKTSGTLASRIQRKKQTFFRKLQQASKKSRKNHNVEDTGRVLPYTRNEGQSLPRGDPAFSYTNILNKDATRDDYTCYRCKHFRDIPRNLPQTLGNGASTHVEQRNIELSFLQAIVWLKSSAACASQIPLAQLHQIFNEQSSIYNHRVLNEDIDDIHVERLRSPVDKNLSTHERTSTQGSFVMSNPPSTSGTSCVPLQTKICTTPQRKISYAISESTQGSFVMSNPPSTSGTSCVTLQPKICTTPQRKISYAISESTQDKLLDPVSMNNSIESFVEPLTLASTSSRHVTANERRREVSKFCIIPETDVESSSANEDFHDNPPEHQCFEFEEDTGCSAASKNDIERVNKEIIENEDTLLIPKNYADVPSERKSILPARNQSIDSIFDFENNVDKECKSVDSIKESNGSSKSLVITQISSLNSENFKFLLDNNSPWQISNTGNSNDESAYSTTRIDMCNCDTEIEAISPIICSKRMYANTKYELQSCKKKTRGKVSSSHSNGMPESDGSPKSLVITPKYISQMSNVHNDENFGFQINNSPWRTSDIISENPEDDAAVAAESIVDKANIERCYEPQSCNELTITCEKVTASSPIIQRAVMPGTKRKIRRKEMTATPSVMQGTVTPDNNVKHRYNLRPRNKRNITEKMRSFSSMIQSQEERRSQRVLNLPEKKNANKDVTISANWLNFTVQSLRMDSVIVASIKVILSTLCDERTAEEYATRGYWKDSSEEKAVDAILNISNIFTTEDKPNICVKEIVMAIAKTFNEMTKRVQLNKIYHIQTSMWIYRIQIILEFCNSLPVCVKIIDCLMRKLKSLQSVLINVKTIRRDTCVIINQLHLVFYALNIAVRKYRTIVPSDQRSRPAEKVIPHVADLWKTHYIDKELKHAGIDLDAAEREWINALENSATVLMEHFVQLAEKSFSLVRVLNSQSSTRIT